MIFLIVGITPTPPLRRERIGAAPRSADQNEARRTWAVWVRPPVPERQPLAGACDGEFSYIGRRHVEEGERGLNLLRCQAGRLGRGKSFDHAGEGTGPAACVKGLQGP